MQNDLRAAAQAAARAGKQKQAIDLWLELLEHDPDNSQALGELGLLYSKLKLFSKSVDYLRKALAQDRKNTALQLSLANSLVQLGQFAEAETCYRQVITQESQNISAHIGFAKLFLRNNQVEQAIVILQTALANKPSDIQVHWQLAEIFRTIGKVEEADAYLRQILELRSESALAQKARQILSESYARSRGLELGAFETLRSENLEKVYGKRHVVRQVSIEVRQGEIVGLLGPNGAGKTTTFYMITGMIRPNSGKIFLNDIDITRMPMYRRARLGVGYLSQEPSIFRKLTVEENILAILQTLKLTKKQREDRLQALLTEFGITHIRKNRAYNLSGGERRRVEISRALVLNPKFLLLDEPFAGIDPIAVEDIQNIVHRLRERGIGILITDHNVHETLAITDRAYLLFDGRVLKSGSAEFLANDPEAKTLYLGDKFRLDR